MNDQVTTTDVSADGPAADNSADTLGVTEGSAPAGASTSSADPEVPTSGTEDGSPSSSDSTPWYSSLDEDYRKDESITKFETANDLVKAYKDSQVVVPDKYELPESIPEDFGEFASKSRLTQEQVNDILRYNEEQLQQQGETFRKVQEEGVNSLMEEWGESAQENVNLAKRALSHFDNDSKEMREFLRVTQSGNNPIVIRFLSGIGQLLKEDGHIQSDSVNPSQARSPAEVLYPKQATGE